MGGEVGERSAEDRIGGEFLLGCSLLSGDESVVASAAHRPDIGVQYSVPYMGWTSHHVYFHRAWGSLLFILGIDQQIR